MNVLETEWWTLALPPEWWAEAEEESVLIGDQDDVGCIEISTLHKESGEFTLAELQQIALSEAEQELAWEKAELGEFSGVSARYTDQEAAIREWYMYRGSMLLFITYSCDLDNAGMDDAAVDELLDTLMKIET